MVSGHGLRDGSPNAPIGLVRGIAIAATLIVALLPAAPAWADDPSALVPPPTAVDSLSGSSGDSFATQQSSVDTTGSASNASQNNTATNTQTTTTTGGNGGTATGGKAGPAQGVGDGSQSSSRGGTAYANGGRAESHTTLINEQSSQTSEHAGSGPGHRSDVKSNPGRRDSFVTKAAKPHGTAGAGTADRVTALEAMERLAHEAAKAGSLGGRPGHPSPMPNQNPFFNLLNAPGGADAGLTMLLLFAVLAASFALPRESFKAFRTRAVVWRPLAYVPPIELPG